MNTYIDQNKRSVSTNEKGFASIVVAIVMVIVLALLTTGFAQVVRREQRSALDKQLATQAFYAAESGINEVHSAIVAKTITATTLGAKADGSACLTAAELGTAANQTISQNNGVYYSCATVNMEPTSAAFNNVGADTSRATSFTASGQPKDLTVKWGSADKHNNYPGSVTATPFSDFTTWNSSPNIYPGVIELSISPLGTLTRAVVAASTFTVYLYPSTGGTGTVNYSTVGTGQGLIRGDCDPLATPYQCKLIINNLAGTSGPYLIRLTNHYDASNILITATDTSGLPVKFIGSQAIVDVTGKARTVLKRLQVRIPLGGNEPVVPNYPIEGQNICKRIQTAPIDPTTNPLGTTFVDPSGTVVTSPPCDVSK